MSTEILITLACAIIGSGALQAVITEFIRRSNEKKKKPTALETAVRLLLQDKIEHLATKAIQNGETTKYERTFLHRCHETYQRLGGNGDISQLMSDYDKLPIKY